MHDVSITDWRAGGKFPAGIPISAHGSHQWKRGAPVALPSADTLAVVIPREALDTLTRRADILASAAMIVARCHWRDRTAATLARELSAHAAILHTLRLMRIYDAGALADLLAGGSPGGASGAPGDSTCGTTGGVMGGATGGAMGGAHAVRTGARSPRRSRPHAGKVGAL